MMLTMDRRTLFGAVALSFMPGVGAAIAASPRRYPVRMVEPVFIPVSAGIKLSGRFWLPEAAAGERFPVVLEYIPYRTFDRYRPVDDYWGAALAERGIAFARVDVRGSGNSEGVLLDEYLESEQDDGVDVVAWLAKQSWCNGAVGMRGISWGGFSTLQVAARRPPALKAIMPMCATDMRFRNDAHYVGGIPGLTNLKWAAGFEMVMSAPPDPAVVGPDWEKMWRTRLEATPSIAARWLAHDSNDEYWRHGSVGLTPEAITCPTYIVDGWADSYAQSAERLLRDLRVPRKAIIGPWGHSYPQFSRPGPRLDWIEEEERWWKHWLAGEQNGVMDGPALRFHLNYETPAQTELNDIPGHWAAEQNWPSPTIRDRTLHLAPKRLSDTPSRGKLRYKMDKLVGLTAPEWIPYAATELPRDQRQDDERSLVFDLPLSENLDVVGTPRLHVRVASDQPIAALAARFCEVDAQGRSWLVTYGILNLSFRNGFTSTPEPLKPGRSYDVVIELGPIAHRFKAGSTLRLALSDSMWPLVWPSPVTAKLEFALAGCRLMLPVRPTHASELPFPIPEGGIKFPSSNPGLDIKEQANGRVRVEGGWPASSSTVDATKTELSGSGPDMLLDYDPAQPNSCRWEIKQSSRYHRSDWDCETRVSIEMTSTPTHFIIKESLVALNGGKYFYKRDNIDKIERKYS